jgi:surface protein
MLVNEIDRRKYLDKMPPNTFIGGIGAVCNSSNELAALIVGLPANYVYNFQKNGNDVSCYVAEDWNTGSASMNSQYITYFDDRGGRVKNIGYRTLRGCSNLEWFNFPEAITVADESFILSHKIKRVYLPKLKYITGGYTCLYALNGLRTVVLPELISTITNYNNFCGTVTKCRRIYIPKCTDIGVNALRNNVAFSGVQSAANGGCTIYANPYLATSNNGEEEGDLAWARTQNIEIRYVTDFSVPNKVTNLSIAEIHQTGFKLNLTTPSSVNEVDFYEIYVNGEFYDEAPAEALCVQGLDPNTAYEIKVIAVDMFYNRSDYSNTVIGTTLATQGFKSTWDTTLTSTGSTATNQIKLPLISAGTYDFLVNWGDGTSNTITTWNQAEVTHTYASAGVKNITITGKIRGWQHNNNGDKLKILSVQSWGELNIGNVVSAFFGCSNLNLDSVVDWLDFYDNYTMGSWFYNCTSLTSINNLNEWFVYMNRDITNLFRAATNFSQPLNFPTSNVTQASYTFYNALLFNGAVTFDTKNIVNMTNMFALARAMNSPITFSDTSKVTNFSYMFNATNVFNQPIDFDTSAAIQVNNMFNSAIVFDQPIDFDLSNCVNASALFASASKFNSPITLRNTSKITNWSAMFQSATLFNQNVEFDTSGATNMATMFNGAAWFNKPINFDTSNVTLMNSMFQTATRFNQPVTFSDTSTVTNMSNMFYLASAFNQPINFNTINVTTMATMFRQAGAFNQPINFNCPNNTSLNSFLLTGSNFNSPINITTSDKLLSMESFLSGSPKFNSTVVVTDTSKVTTFLNCFYNCALFDKPVNFNTSSATNLQSVFYGCQNFNSPVNFISTSACVNMSNMFYTAWKFNQPLNFDTSNVTNFQNMFYQCYRFNQDVSNWNTGKATNMISMFHTCTDFDQNLGAWNVSNVTSITSFMQNKTPTTFSAANLDAIYIGWASRPVKPNNSITFTTAKRTAASTSARGVLAGAPNNWTITDGGI